MNVGIEEWYENQISALMDHVCIDSKTVPRWNVTFHLSSAGQENVLWQMLVHLCLHVRQQLLFAVLMVGV